MMSIYTTFCKLFMDVVLIVLCAVFKYDAPSIAVEAH